MKWVVVVTVSLGVAFGCGEGSGPAPDASIAPPAQTLDPMRSELTVDRTSAMVRNVVTAAVVLRDTEGKPIPGLQVTLVATGTLNEIVQPGATDASGQATGTWTTTRAEPKSITAMLPDGSTLGPRTVTFAAGPASKLVFDTQPPDVEAGASMAVQVSFEDADGNVATSILPVTLRLGANPAATELEGSVQASPSMGVASFSGLHVDVPAPSYSLMASAMGLPDVESEPFDVIPGEPVLARSSMTASPFSNDADGVSPAVISIRVRNQYDVPIPGLGAAISVTGTGNLLGASNPSTSADGTIETTLRSTTAESKVITATVGGLTLTAPIAFFPAACTVMLPNRPSVPFEFAVKAMVTTDLDGDGHVDVADAEQITTNPPHQSQVVVRRGRGDGRFHPAVTVSIAGAASSLSAADLDDDGDLDLVATVSDQSVAHALLQSTGGMFGPPTSTTLGGAASATTFADVDEDGAIDMIASLVDINRVAVHLGTGTGTFGAGSLLTVGDHPVTVATADFNRDGHVDIGVSQLYEGSYSTMLGNGDGTFGPRRTRGAVRAGAQIVADLDHDSDLDVIVASMQGDGVDVLLANGDGTFRYEWGYSSGIQSQSMALADLNADTHADLVLSGFPTLLVLHGTGTGRFTAADRYATTSPRLSGGLALADLDEDGMLDVVSAGLGIDVTAGLGAGTFAAPAVYGLPRGFLHGLDADFNGDGRPDVIEFADTQHRLLLGAADGSLSPGTAFADGNQQTLLRAGDVNNDGHQDVVMLGAPEFGMQFALRVGLGTGTGTFSFGANIPNVVYGDDLVLARVNNDPHLDLILFHGGDFRRGLNFSAGTGTGSFGTFNTLIPKISTTTDPRALAVADLDKDGDVDLVVAERRELVAYTNDGNGSFAARSYAIPDLAFLDGLSAVAVGDFDGDTWLDAAVGHAQGRIHVFRGLTGGAFAPVPERYELRSSLITTSIDRLDTRDIDADGTLDLYVVGTGVWLMQGFGNGDFRAPRLYNVPGGTGDTGRAEYVLRDRNADGRIDIVASTTAGIAVVRQGVCRPFVP